MRPPSRLPRASLAVLATCILACGTQSNHTITGTVNGASAVTVNLAGAATRTATTDGNGGYAFSGLADGAYTVTPAKTGYTFTPASLAVTVAGADLAGQDFAATPVPHAIAGTVTGASSVTVNLTGAATRTATTGGSGGYAFAGLADGAYTVTPAKTGYTFTPASLAVTVAGADVAGQDFAATSQVHAISGLVTGASAAEVSLRGPGLPSGCCWRYTDEDGGYAFEGLANGTYTVTPSKQGHAFTPVRRSVTVSDADATAQDFAGAPEPHAISGKVHGGVGVTIDLTGDALGTTSTDPYGGYAFTGLPSGTYTVTPVPWAYAITPSSRTVTVAGADVNGQDFMAIAVLHHLSGTVSGVDAFTVNLTGALMVRGERHYGSGAYALTYLPDGVYTVTPARAGYTFTPPSRTAIVAGADVTGLDFVGTPAPCEVSGTVTGANDVTVGVSGPMTMTTLTDDFGAFCFLGLVDGAYTVAPLAAGALTGFTFAPPSRSVTLSGASVKGQDFALADVARTIHGTVTGAGEVELSLTGSATGSARTDAFGDYFFHVADGTYTVTPSKAGYTFTPPSRSVSVSGADVPLQDFVATPAPHAITGTVSGASAVTVSLSGAEADTTTTDAEGRYAFTGLADGVYTVTPAKPGYAFTPASLVVTVAGADVAGQDFVARSEYHAIGGKVACRAGSLLTGTVFRSVALALTGPATASTTTDSSGRYAFPELADGTYSVTPSYTGYSFTPASRAAQVIGADVTEADFVGAPLPISVAGRVAGVASARVTAVRVCTGSLAICGTCDIGCVEGATATDASGAYSMTLPGWCPLIPPAYYRVTPSAPGHAFTPEFRTVGGAGGLRTDLDFVAMPTHAIRGKVTGAGDVAVNVAGPTSVVSAIPDSGGNYAITDLRDGAYTLTPAKEGYTFVPTSRSVTVSGADVDDQDFNAVAAPP